MSERVINYLRKKPYTMLTEEERRFLNEKGLYYTYLPGKKNKDNWLYQVWAIA